jgi:hypothetical protein
MNYVILTTLLSLLFDMRLHYLTTPFTHEYSNKHNTHIVSLFFFKETNNRFKIYNDRFIIIIYYKAIIA